MKTRILLTVGDFNGIGPEIILKTLSDSSILKKYDLTVVTPVYVLEFYAKRMMKKFYADEFNVIPVGYEKLKIRPGAISDDAGFISGLAIVKAIELCMNGDYDAVVTAPISKAALNMGGFNYEGHTEMLGDFGKAKSVCMIMVSGSLKIALQSTHIPVRKVASQLDRIKIQDKLILCRESLRKDFRAIYHKIGVLSLNPHAGESGKIGREETDIIEPAIQSLNKKLRKRTFFGPFPPDAYFASGTYRMYELTFAMYHDQGLIPFKMLSGFRGVNYTAGLSFVRTSPDHGTAFDIAGKNKASEESFVEAIKLASKIHNNRIS